jgi:hypothetical protein
MEWERAPVFGSSYMLQCVKQLDPWCKYDLACNLCCLLVTEYVCRCPMPTIDFSKDIVRAHKAAKALLLVFCQAVVCFLSLGCVLHCLSD